MIYEENLMLKKQKIGAAISENFDIPLDGILDIPSVHLIGNSNIDIDGCVSIKKYDLEEIIIRCKGYVLKILGSNLSMVTFSKGRVSIRGIISSYTIEELKKGKQSCLS